MYKSFLAVRKLIVNIKNVNSSEINVNIEAPQWAHLVSLPSNIHITELADSIEFGIQLPFIDDLKLFCNIHFKEDCLKLQGT